MQMLMDAVWSVRVPGYERDCTCYIRAFDRTGYIVVCSEVCGALSHLGINQGVSVTNAAEHLMTMWRHIHPERPFVWIEHYPARGTSRTLPNGRRCWQVAESFDVVRAEGSNQAQRYVNPWWRPSSRRQVEQLIGGAWPDPHEGADGR